MKLLVISQLVALVLCSNWYVSVNTGNNQNPGTSPTEAFQDLRQALNVSADGDTIYVLPGIYEGVENTGLTIETNVTIIGSGQHLTVFQGESNHVESAYIFNLFGSRLEVKIQSVTLTLASNLIQLSCQQGNVTLHDILFEAGDIGLLVNEDLNIIGTHLNFTSAMTNGVWIFFAGQGVKMESAQFYNSVFACSSHSIMYDGSSISFDWAALVVIQNCSFTGGGPQVAFVGTDYTLAIQVKIKDCNFTVPPYPNIRINPMVNGYDCAIEMTGYNLDVEIDSCKFINCSAAGPAYGVIQINNAGTVKIYSSEFRHNNNTAIYIGTIPLTYIDGCLFENNTSVNNNLGGAIGTTGYNYRNVTIVNSVFRNNSVAEVKDTKNTLATGAVSLLLGYYGMIKNCTFEYNAGLNQGAAIYTGSPLQVVNCTFEENRSSVQGGAIYINGQYKPSIQVNSSVFIDNNATSQGGAIYVTSNAKVKFHNVTFSSNVAQEGGALYVSSDAQLSIYDSIFVANDALSDGGAIECQNATLSVNSAVFYSNTALTGEAMYCVDCSYSSVNVIANNQEIVDCESSF